MMRRISVVSITALAVITSILSFGRNPIYAAEKKLTVQGLEYEMNENTEYRLLSAKHINRISDKTQFGQFRIIGDVKYGKDDKGNKSFEVDSGNVEFAYYPSGPVIEAKGADWHLIEDKATKVGGEKLPDKILYGAVIVQSSIDRKKWITDNVYTNFAVEGSKFNYTLYETKDIQQINGCYYRVTVVYMMEKKLPDKKYGFVSVDNFDRRRMAEVYEFYVVNSEENMVDATKPEPEPDIILADLDKNTKRVKKDSGYGVEEPMKDNDPHLGWNLGTFYVNGYTRDIDDNGTTVFLKNLGDRVTLWYKLEQDIDCLDGKDNLSISGDDKGFDQAFKNIPKTDFKRGALFIRYKDRYNKEKTITYFNFLEANTKTGADTRVELFEEGDYEVALDYVIKDDSKIASYSYYRVSFEFKIRNGNCMFYVFDNKTGNEIANNTVAPEGIRIDLAKSKYLDIDVTRTTLVDHSTGKTTDTRMNKPGKDGAVYTDPGIYTFKVSHRTIPNMSTTKTFYVGTDPYYELMAQSGKSLKEITDIVGKEGDKYLKAMKSSKKSLDEIDKLVREDNYTIDSNGKLIPPPPETKKDDKKEEAPSAEDKIDSDNKEDEIDYLKEAGKKLGELFLPR